VKRQVGFFFTLSACYKESRKSLQDISSLTTTVFDEFCLKIISPIFGNTAGQDENNSLDNIWTKNTFLWCKLYPVKFEAKMAFFSHSVAEIRNSI
jgi:hypothetical protein